MGARNTEQIVEQIRQGLKSENSRLSEFPEYGNLHAIFRSIAAVVAEQDSKLESLSEGLYIDTASGDSLDRKAREFGVSRIKGSKAIGSALASSPTNLTIPQGTIFTHLTTSLQFVTTNRANLRPGKRSEVSIESLTMEEEANLEAGSILRSALYPTVNMVVGNSYSPLSDNYIGNLSGAAPIENDFSLRDRIRELLTNPSYSTARLIQTTALNTPGVTDVSIKENHPSVGFVTLYTNLKSKTSLLSLQRDVDTVKPIGTTVLLRTFNTINVDIIASVGIYSDRDLEELERELKGQVSSYINRAREDGISKEGLAAVFLNNSRVRTIEIVVPTGEIQLSEDSIARLKTFDINFRVG
jgi:hypothetical protein